MNQQAARKRIQDVEDVIKKARRNTTCLFPGCSEEPIGSHVIARTILEVIADKGHVLTWFPRRVTAWDMARSIDAGQPLDYLYEKPISVGIGDKNKVTEPLFCRDHDNTVFAPLDDREFSFQAEQVMLLASRAVCSMILSTSATAAIYTAVAKQPSLHYSLSTPEPLRRLQGFQATELVLQARHLYAQIQATRDYDQLGWAIYLVNMQPCIAATYSFIPVEGNDAKAIINGTQAVTVADMVSFSFLPYKLLNCSICVISWLRESQRAHQFMTFRRVNALSEKEQRDLFLSFAFESPTLYISPIWWQSLSDEKREVYTRVHLEAYRRHDELV